jgi:hypothetical protein
MKTFVRHALLLLAVIAVCQTGIALAGDYYWVSSENTDLASAAGDQKAAAPAQAPSVEASGGCESACNGCVSTACDCCRTWYVDYRIQQMFGYTAYQFGTAPQLGGTQYDPISKLEYPLNSTWNGLRVGVQSCQWDVHLEWLMPLTQHINGSMYDWDWSATNIPPSSLSGHTARWNDGQKLEIEADYKYSDCFLGRPIEVWPLAGFRWQRFNMTAYDGIQLLDDGTMPVYPVGTRYPGDNLTLNQQFYTGYIGFQLRTCVERECRPPIDLMFQFDWGGTGAYNVDHHLSYEARGIHRYTMESTGGDSVHVALSADVPLNCHLSLGLQADYTRIRTTGTHRWIMSGNTTPVDETWSNGVLVKSEQTAITAYLQYAF